MNEILESVLGKEQAARVYEERIKNKPLLLASTDADNARAQRRQARLAKRDKLRKRRKPLPLSAKEKRQLGLYDLKDQDLSYHNFLPLHRLWQEYMGELFQSPAFSFENVAPKLCAADYHGCEMTVVKSTCPSRVGIQGICIKETQHTFNLLTEQNELKIIPKYHSAFSFDVDVTDASGFRRTTRFQLYGSNFSFRASERAKRKFKSKIDI